MRVFLCAALLLAAQTAMGQQCTFPCCPCVIVDGDFAAYELKVPLSASATVTTAYGSASLQVDRARRLHAPLAPQPLDGLHFVGYEVDSPTPFAPGAVTLNTALGQVTGTASRVKWLVIPANKSLAAPAPAAPPDQDAFLCFSGQLKGPNSDVPATDQFGSQVMSLHKVDSVCAPATLDGSAPSASWRVCFDTRPKPAVDPPAIWATTILQTINDYDLEPVDEICVQATLQ